jgi:hypothetical protein
VLAALLLHDQLRRNAAEHTGHTPLSAGLPVSESLREAGNVLDSFLRRVRVAV